MTEFLKNLEKSIIKKKHQKQYKCIITVIYMASALYLKYSEAVQ